MLYFKLQNICKLNSSIIYCIFRMHFEMHLHLFVYVLVKFAVETELPVWLNPDSCSMLYSV